MSLDGNIVKRLTADFKEELTSGRIVKIYQISKYDFIFNIQQDTKKQLLISASPNYARIHLTEYHYEKPETPPMFCMFLRKYLEGGIIENIHQVSNDRIIIFDIKKRNELGDITTKKLIVEVMGRHSNIIITDEENKIMEGIKHVMPFEDNARTVFKGALYHTPDSNKIDPYDKEKRNQFLSNPDNITAKAFSQNLIGVSPLFIKEVLYRFENSTDNIKNIFDSILSENHPSIYSKEKDYFYFTNLQHLNSEATRCSSVNQLLDKYYFDRDTVDIIRQKSKDIHKFIKNYIVRIKNKIEKLSNDLRKTSKMDEWKKKGELIQANMYTIQKGQAKLTCLDYYENKEITIELDQRLSPIENMEKYFKKYKKLKTSIPYLEKHILESKIELRYFEELLHQTENASLKDFEEIRDELEDKKYIKSKKQQKKRNKKPNYDTLLDADGVEILVGKNNIQNEFITHKLAKHNEVWFHVKDAPGSHVVVRKAFPLSETTIRTAANIAAYYSKMRKSGTVPVEYVEKRYLKKVPGKVTSFVTYTNNKTIYIDPDEDFVLSLNRK